MLEKHKINCNTDNNQKIHLFNEQVKCSTKYELSEVECALYKLLNITISRLECIVMKLEIESEKLGETAKDDVTDNRVGFITDLKTTRQSFIFLRELVVPKKEMIAKLQN